MKQPLVLGIVGALVLVPVAATATAQTSTQTRIAIRTTVGKTVSLKGGKLRVAKGGKNIDFVVDKKTECSVAGGERGAPLRCAILGQKGYVGERVRVGWYNDAKKRRIAGFVTVILR